MSKAKTSRAKQPAAMKKPSTAIVEKKQEKAMSLSVSLDEMADQLRSMIAETIKEITAALPPALALQAADGVLETLRQELGGTQLYINATDRIDREAVKADFMGNNHQNVCRKHNISKATLYRIIGHKK